MLAHTVTRGESEQDREVNQNRIESKAVLAHTVTRGESEQDRTDGNARSKGNSDPTKGSGKAKRILCVSACYMLPRCCAH